jgi:hypothetical protein
MYHERAVKIREDAISLMRQNGRRDLAASMEDGVLPGDEEMYYFSQIAGYAILVIPTEHAEHAAPMIHGDGPVG